MNSFYVLCVLYASMGVIDLAAAAPTGTWLFIQAALVMLLATILPPEAEGPQRPEVQVMVGLLDGRGRLGHRHAGGRGLGHLPDMLVDARGDPREVDGGRSVPHLRRVPHRIVINMAGRNALDSPDGVNHGLSAHLGVLRQRRPIPSDVEDHWLPPVEERVRCSTTTPTSSPASPNGSYEIDEVRSVYVPIPSINPTDGGAGVTGGAEVHLGLWLPVIEGCDWDAGSVVEGCQVPVIAEIGPYYDDGDVDALTPADRLGRFLIENFVPHGFGVAQVSVFGTGESNHCMDLMGHDEQAGIKGAVDWLGMQPWSNGKVGAIGKSYDGSTPWNAAASGSEYLATIVPMSGLIGMHDLMWRNGSMEARCIMHNGVYGSFGLDGDSGDIENARWPHRGLLRVRRLRRGTTSDGPDRTTGGAPLPHGRAPELPRIDLSSTGSRLERRPAHGLPDHQMAIDAGFDVKGSWPVGPRLPRPIRRPRGLSSGGVPRPSPTR